MEVENALSTMATLAWAEGSWIGRWAREQKEAWRKQIFEVQTWRKVRGPARTVVCETRDGHQVAILAYFDVSLSESGQPNTNVRS